MKKSYLLMALLCLVCFLTPLLVPGVFFFRSFVWAAEGSMTDFGLYLRTLLPVVCTTFKVIIPALTLALPAGLLSAIYMVFYAKNPLQRWLLNFTRTMTSIPSILYGITGLYVFSRVFGTGQSILTGSLTLALFILPVIVCEATFALQAVPESFINGARSLAASRTQILYHLIIPDAMPSLLSSVLKSLARMSGEAASLILTVGVALSPPRSFLSSGRTLGVHLYYIAQEAVSRDEYGQAFMTGTVLMLFCLVLQSLALSLEKRLRRTK